MATIRSQMVLNDGMSAVLKRITSALDTTLNAFEQVQRASGRAVDAAQIAQARSQLVGANAEIQDMADGYRRAAEQEENLNRGLRTGGSLADGMLGKVKTLVATLAASAGLNKLIGLSDQMTSTTARLSFLVDDGGSVDELEAKIMTSAQRSRAAYLDTASAIASMGANAGAAFSSNDELIAFMEQVNRQFTIGGASAQGQAAAMLQLTQAMAAGALRGEELGGAVNEHNNSDTAHASIRVDLTGLDSRLKTLELKYGTNVTGSSFEVTFVTLTDVVVTGVWNEELGRIEF